jgi:anti-sigma regulatory factor (Ser/Thr protein kinase)
MPYEEKEVRLLPGENVVLYSDGLVEAHNPQGDMFGFPRLRELLAIPKCGDELVTCLTGELSGFTGPGWEQEDDVTVVTIERAASAEPVTVAEFDVASQPGNERPAMEQVSAVAAELRFPAEKMDRLKTAVAEATMNAMEHGNHYDPQRPVHIQVCQSPERLVVRVTDRGGGQPIPPTDAPDLDAKLAGLQSPRGWGLFLIKNMVDQVNEREDADGHTLELVFFSRGGAQ